MCVAGTAVAAVGRPQGQEGRQARMQMGVRLQLPESATGGRMMDRHHVVQRHDSGSQQPSCGLDLTGVGASLVVGITLRRVACSGQVSGRLEKEL